MYTTLRQIATNNPPSYLVELLMRRLGISAITDDEISILFILDTVGIMSALWALRTVEYGEDTSRRIAIAFARATSHILEVDAELCAIMAKEPQLSEYTSDAAASAIDEFLQVLLDTRKLNISSVAARYALRSYQLAYGYVTIAPIEAAYAARLAVFHETFEKYRCRWGYGSGADRETRIKVASFQTSIIEQTEILRKLLPA